MYGACTADREHVCLIMELMEGGSLHQRIYDRCKRRMGYLEILQVWAGLYHRGRPRVKGSARAARGGMRGDWQRREAQTG